MAGNKKPARKGKVKVATGSMESYFGAQARANQLQQKVRRKQNDRVAQLNNTPLGHPVNKHKIDATFAPIEKALEDAERTKTHLYAENGEAVMYIPKEQTWTSIPQGVLHMCFIFENVGRARVWPKMPPGLRTYAIGLQIGRVIDADDFKGARETIAWMRKQLATLTPIQWKELFDWAASLDEQEKAREAAHG